MDIAKTLGMVEGKIYKATNPLKLSVITENKYRINNGLLETSTDDDQEWYESQLYYNTVVELGLEEIPEPPKEYTLEELAGMSQEKLNGKRLVSVITGKICTARHQPGTTDLWLDTRLTGKGLYAKEILGKWTIVEGE